MVVSKTSFIGANILNVEIESNSMMGGDSGHGGYCEITFQSDDEFYVNGIGQNIIKLKFTGDSERENLKKAFRYMADILENEYKC